MTHGIRLLRDDLPLLGLVLAGLLALVYALSADTFALNILATAFLFGGLATAWNIIGGLGGQFSLGHSVFFATGAYVTANLYLRLQVSPWLGAIAAALVAALLAMALAWPVFRLRGPFFAIATMAFTEVLLALAMYFDTVTGGARGVSIPFRAGFANMIFRDRLSWALVMLGFLGLCLVALVAITRSRLGYALQAVRDNEAAAEALREVEGVELAPGFIVRRKAFPNAAASGLSVLEYDDPKAIEELNRLTEMLFVHATAIGAK